MSNYQNQDNITKFEFLLSLEGHIVCQRFFNVRDYNPQARRSMDLHYYVKNICDDIETVKLLINILDTKRADKYEDWIRVAWCLRNIDHRLIEDWHNFSKKCDGKYDEYMCNKIWNQIKKTGLTMGSLHYWAKNDNPEKYDEIRQETISYFIEKTIDNQTDFDFSHLSLGMIPVAIIEQGKPYSGFTQIKSVCIQ